MNIYFIYLQYTNIKFIIMKRIVLFLIASLLVLTSSIIYKAGQSEAQSASGNPSYNLKMDLALNVTPRESRSVDLYLANVEVPVKFSSTAYVTGADIEVNVTPDNGQQYRFQHIIPAGTLLNAIYSVPIPNTWFSGARWKPEISNIWLLVNPQQNGMEIDIKNIVKYIDK